MGHGFNSHQSLQIMLYFFADVFMTLLLAGIFGLICAAFVVILYAVFVWK
jgi:hypothetical protein